MRPVNSQTNEADDRSVRTVGQSILRFLQSHPDDLDALNEAIMPFAYLTLLKPPHASNPVADRQPNGDSLVSLRIEIPSTTGASNGDLAAESSEPELEVVSPQRLRPDEHPARTREIEKIYPGHSSCPHSSGNNDVETGHNNGRAEIRGNVAGIDGSGRPELECGANQVNSANTRLTFQNNAGENERPTSRQAERGAKCTKYRRRHSSLRQKLQPKVPTRQIADTGSLNLGLRQTELEAETLSPATETYTIEEGSDASVSDHSQLVSAWMDNPEIASMSQSQVLVMHRQPQQELLSYLNLIASIGTVDVIRSFAVGVTQLMCYTRFSYEVPAPPNHLQDIEDADAMQCFWRAAYRSQVNASLVSFGIILHRRSLATLRYCYFKAINSIKCTMQRKGQPGHTKTAIARGILLDTVFPGSDKLELKRMSDRLKNDVTRARNYCKLIEYYGSSGILGLLPRSLTDTRMRDFTDAEFDFFLGLISRLRPDLEAARVTTAAIESGTFSRMLVWGRIIDMSQAGLRPLKDDYDFIQKDTKIILPQVESQLEDTCTNRANAGMMADQALCYSQQQEAEHDIVGIVASAVSHHAVQVGDYDTCGPSQLHDSGDRIQEVSE